MSAYIPKFGKYAVRSGAHKARVWYSLDNRHDGRKCVTIYAKDFESGDALGAMFPDVYKNNTDTMSDYFDKGHVDILEGHPHYAAARAHVEALKARAS